VQQNAKYEMFSDAQRAVISRLNSVAEIGWTGAWDLSGNTGFSQGQDLRIGFSVEASSGFRS